MTANTPTREAKVMMVTTGGMVNFMEIDPIDLPVDSAGLADVFHPGLIGLMDALLDADAAFSEHQTNTMAEYVLVWSDDETMVKGTCPVCDDFFPVSEGFPGDELNEGYEAVCCGCDPDDN